MTTGCENMSDIGPTFNTEMFFSDINTNLQNLAVTIQIIPYAEITDQSRSVVDCVFPAYVVVYDSTPSSISFQGTTEVYHETAAADA